MDEKFCPECDTALELDDLGFYCLTCDYECFDDDPTDYDEVDESVDDEDDWDESVDDELLDDDEDALGSLWGDWSDDEDDDE